MLVNGLCFPSSISLAEEELINEEHSGGFLVEIERIEGEIDMAEILNGIVDIPEGLIHGMTITKELTETEHGTLIIKIKTPGPVPIENLKATSIALPFFEVLCDSNHDGWLCMEKSRMTLSEQDVKSIDLPNVTVETCYEGQCESDREEEIETMSFMHEEENGIEEIETHLQSVNTILGVVDEQLEHAQQSNDKIIDDEQESQVKQSLEQFEQSVEDELLKHAQEIQGHYATFNEHASEFALRTSVVDDILKHVTHVLKQSEEDIENLEESIEEARDTIESEKQNKQTQEALAEYDEFTEKMNEVKALIATAEDKIDNQQQTLEPLEQSSGTMMTALTNFYENIQTTAENLEEHEDADALRSALDVAEPAKELEKRIQNLFAEMTATDLPDETAMQEKVIEEAHEEAVQSIVSISLAKQIEQLDAEIEEEIEKESETWEEQVEQLTHLENEYESLAHLAKLPETLILEHQLNVQLEDQEKDDYRMELLQNMNRWKQWLDTLHEMQSDIGEALDQYERNQQLLSQLVEAILATEERYTTAELSTIAEYLGIESYLQHERQISELMDHGQQVMQIVDPMIEVTRDSLDELEMISKDLVNKILFVNTLNDENFTQFANEVAHFNASVAQMEQPVKQLQNHLAIAEDLLGERIAEYPEFQNMQLTMNSVAQITDRLNVLIEELDALPYFEKIKEQVQELQKSQATLDSIVQ